MTRLTLTTLLLLIFAFLSGCTTYWYQTDKTFDQCRQDRKDCLEELKKYSSNWQKMGNYEFKFMEECMLSKGYTPVKEDKLPLKVKRQDPDRMLHARLRGIAGKIE